MSSREYFKRHSKKDPPQVESGGETDTRLSDIQRVDRRRHEVLDYMLLGHSPSEIAGFLDVEEYTIVRDIEAILEKGYEPREEEIAEVRDEIMTMLRVGARESFRAFKDSQGEVETKTVEYGEGGDAGNGDRNITSEKVKTEKQSGDARHMRNFLDAAEKMGKVSGAQKHKEVEVKQNVQQNSLNILKPDRTKLPDEFDRWTKKPEDKSIPDEDDIEMEDI